MAYLVCHGETFPLCIQAFFNGYVRRSIYNGTISVLLNCALFQPDPKLLAQATCFDWKIANMAINKYPPRRISCILVISIIQNKTPPHKSVEMFCQNICRKIKIMPPDERKNKKECNSHNITILSLQ